MADVGKLNLVMGADVSALVVALNEAKAAQKAASDSMKEHGAATETAVSKLSILDNVLRSTLGPSFSNFRGNLGLLNNSMTEAGNIFAESGEHMSSLGGFAMIAGGALAAFVGVAAAATFELVKMGAEQQQTMTLFQNMGTFTEEVAAQIDEALTTVAEKSRFTNDQVVAALTPVVGRLENLSGAALTVQESTDIMNAALLTSTARHSDLAREVQGLVNVMAMYHAPTSEAAKVSAELYNITRLTGMQTDELASVIGRLESKLNGATPDLATMGAIMVTLTAVTGGSTRAAAALDAAMTTLTGESKATEYALDKLGIKVKDAQGNFIPLNILLPNIEGKLSNLDEASRHAAESDLFGASSAAVMDKALADLGSTMEATRDKISDTTKQEDDANRAAKDFADQVDNAKARVSDLADRLGGQLIVALENAITWIQNADYALNSFLVNMGNAMGQFSLSGMASEIFSTPSQYGNTDAGAAAVASSLGGVHDQAERAADSVTKVEVAVAKVSGAVAAGTGHYQSYSDATENAGKKAKEAKTALEELGVSIDTVRKAMEVLNTPEDIITADLIKLGAKADEAGPKIYELGLTFMKLDEVLLKMGYDSATALDMTQKIADIQAAAEAAKLAAEEQRKAEEAARKAEEAIRKAEEAARQAREAAAASITGRGAKSMLGAILGFDPQNASAVAAQLGEATAAMQKLTTAGMDTGIAIDAINTRLAMLSGRLGTLTGEDRARAEAAITGVRDLVAAFQAGTISSVEFTSAVSDFNSQLGKTAGLLDAADTAAAKLAADLAQKAAEEAAAFAKQQQDIATAIVEAEKKMQQATADQIKADIANSIADRSKDAAQAFRDALNFAGKNEFNKEKTNAWERAMYGDTLDHMRQNANQAIRKIADDIKAAQAAREAADRSAQFQQQREARQRLTAQILGVGFNPNASGNIANAELNAALASQEAGILQSGGPEMLNTLLKLVDLLDGGLAVQMDGKTVGRITGNAQNESAALLSAMGGGL